MANHRDRKLLDLAHRVENCQFRLPGCEGFTGGCQPIHADGLWYNKGTGIKSHDVYHAAGCTSCHRAYENMPKSEKQEAFDRACLRTHLFYWKNGWVGVK
jgi:hypothetical protein